jgi:hypothetical protein
VEEAEKEDDHSQKDKNNNRYNIEFVFDSDVKCAITIHYFATEEFNNGQLM